MGKGDKKTKRGKITMGSYGKKRPHQKKKTAQEKEVEVIKEGKKVKDEGTTVDEKVPKKSKKG